MEALESDAGKVPRLNKNIQSDLWNSMQWQVYISANELEPESWVSTLSSAMHKEDGV